jgi:hypothetical protein
MPALPFVNKVIRVGLVQSLSEDTSVLNRIFFSYTGSGPSPADLVTLAGTIGTAWGADIAPYQSTNVNLFEIDIDDLTSATAAAIDEPSNVPGTDAAAMLPAGTAAVLQQGIARRYRGGHPRAYICGITQDKLQDAQTWKATFISGFPTSWQAFITAIKTSPPASFGALSQVNVSYYQGFTTVTNPITHRARNVPTLRGTPLVDPMIGYSMNPKVGSQRRRNLQSR